MTQVDLATRSHPKSLLVNNPTSHSFHRSYGISLVVWTFNKSTTLLVIHTPLCILILVFHTNTSILT
jgi:hypothetical protein